MGAVAVAAAMAVLPSAAVADNGDSVVQFKLPSKATMEQLEAHGTDFDHGFIDAPGGGILASAVVNDDEKAILEAQGYPAVKVLQTQADVDALRAERDATIAAETAAKAALTSSAADKSKKAIAGTVRAQRADYWEDVSGRYLSIEGTTDGRPRITPRDGSYTGPALQAAWFAADGTQLGSGQLSAILDTGVTPAAYLYHGSRFRVGNVGDGGMPAYVRIAAPNGDVATLDAKKWVGNGGTTSPGGFIQDFNTHYVTPRESYAKMRELASEFSNISDADEPAEQDERLPAQGADRHRHDGLRSARAPAPPTRRSRGRPGRGRRPDLVAWGHEGGNNLTASLVNDGAAKPLRSRSPATRSRSTPRPTPPARSRARPPRSSPRSTPTRPPRRSSPAALYRTNAGARPSSSATARPSSATA